MQLQPPPLAEGEAAEAWRRRVQLLQVRRCTPALRRRPGLTVRRPGPRAQGSLEELLSHAHAREATWRERCAEQQVDEP